MSIIIFVRETYFGKKCVLLVKLLVFVHPLSQYLLQIVIIQPPTPTLLYILHFNPPHRQYYHRWILCLYT